MKNLQIYLHNSRKSCNFAPDLDIKSKYRDLDISTSRLSARIRYRSQAVPVKKIDGNCIEFATPVWGITPGQSVVLYSDDLVVGGGIIL